MVYEENQGAGLNALTGRSQRMLAPKRDEAFAAQPQNTHQELLAEAEKYLRLIGESRKTLEADRDKTAATLTEAGYGVEDTLIDRFKDIDRNDLFMEDAGDTQIDRFKNIESDRGGATLDEVRSLQELLVSAGYDIGKTGEGGRGVDSVFGPRTAGAAIDFFSPREALGETPQLPEEEAMY